jgi:hypothetical protein
VCEIRRSLSREIEAALAFKLLALIILYLLCFSGSHARSAEMSGLTTGHGEARKLAPFPRHMV